jgi:oligosaccharyltransferase complex subunit beta
LTPKLLLDFVNAGGNILLTLSSTNPTPSALVSLLLELDIHLPTDRNPLVVDHFNYDTLSAPETHDVVLVPRPDALRPDVKNFFRGEGKDGEVIAFPRGVGQTLGNTSPLLTPILRAPRTAYSYNTKDDAEGVEDPFAVGQQLSLITTMQARNSARFTVVGSAELFQNKWFNVKVKRSVGMNGVGKDAKDAKTSNQAFAKEVTGWTFNEIGVLKVGKIEHYLNEGGVKSNITNPKIYRVKNDVVSSQWSRLLQLIADFVHSLMRLSCPSMSGTSGFPSPLYLAIRSNSSSQCCHPSTASPSRLRLLPKPPQSTPQASNSQTNMEFSISK